MALTVLPKVEPASAPGGRVNGRMPSVLKQLAREVLTRRQLIERLGEIGSGDLQRLQVFTKHGLTQMLISPSIKEQILAIAALAKMGDVVREETAPEGKKIKVFVLAEIAQVYAGEERDTA